MRFSRLVVLLLALALLGLSGPAYGAGDRDRAGGGVPALGATEPVPGAFVRTYTTEVTVFLPRTLTYRQGFEITGQVLATNEDDPEDHGALQGAEVTLERRWAGSDEWRTLAATTTSYTDVPVYEFREVARRNAAYRVVYAGESYTDLLETVTYEPDSTSRHQRVRRRLDARVLEPRPGRFVITGDVDPGWGTRPVQLERRTCQGCAWSTYDETRTSSTGGYRFPVDFPPRGTWFYRVRVRATTQFAVSYSQRFRAVTY